MGRFSYDDSRQDLTRIIDAMPTETCRAMHLDNGERPLALMLLKGSLQESSMGDV